jgi:uncharacterized membrane protein
MDSSNENNDSKITPTHSSYPLATWLAIAIMAIQVIVSLASYPFLPARVPTHWNAAGQIDAYAPKWVNAVMFPLMSIGIYILIRGLVAISPKLGNQNPRTNREVINLFLVGILLFMLVIQLLVTTISLGFPVNVTLVVSLAISILFIFLGNYMGKLRRNFWGGIRTPWTLASDSVWERTHRLGSWLFVIGGLIGIMISFIPSMRLYGIVVIVFGISIISAVYSYVIYHQLETNGKEPLSPPFDQ